MENVYANNIPALPPLAAGVDDGPAPAIAQGEPLAFQDVTAAHRQHQNRKRLAVNDPPLVTGDELVASKHRKHIVQSFNFDGPTPAWALQLMASMQQVRDDLQQFTRRYDQDKERGMNRSRGRATDPIEPLVRMLDGDKPNAVPHHLWFPQNQEELLDATGSQVSALLQFYDLELGGTLGEQTNRLMSFLGVIVA